MQCYREKFAVFKLENRDWMEDSSTSEESGGVQDTATDTRQMGGTTQARGGKIGRSEGGEAPLPGKEDESKASVFTDAQDIVDPVTTQANSSAPERSGGGATTPQDDNRSATASTKKNKKTHQAKELRPQRPEVKCSPAKTLSQSKPSNKEGASE